MLVEAGVFGSYGCIYEMFRQFVITYVSPVLYVECGENFSVLGYNLCCEFVVRVFQLLE